VEKKMGNLPKVKDRPQPRQVFWAKSLEGLRAMVPLCSADRFRVNDEEPRHIEQSLALAPKLEPIIGALNEEAACATLCAGIQFPSSDAPIVGQQSTKKQIDTNPIITINFSQPLVQIPLISEQDISSQERRVLDARKRLQELRKSLLMR